MSKFPEQRQPGQRGGANHLASRMAHDMEKIRKGKEQSSGCCVLLLGMLLVIISFATTGTVYFL